jgi:ribosomal protein L11 methyltransferase
LGKSWPALEIHVPGCDPPLVELVIAELDDFQPTAIHESDEGGPMRAFFTTPAARDAAAQALGVAFGSYVYVKRIDVEDEDWAARSQAQLKAIAVGRIVIAPPWDAERLREPFSSEAQEKGSRSPFVIIQPSTGFGTGHHPTTRLALRALQEMPLDNRTVIDIGCGSGVLAIAAIKLGARSAIGVDIDPDALENARENALLNRVDDRIQFEEGDFRDMALRGHVALANLTGALLARSAEALACVVEPGGSLIVSGFLETEKQPVMTALQNFLGRGRVNQEEEWLCGVFDAQRSFQTY